MKSLLVSALLCVLCVGCGGGMANNSSPTSTPTPPTSTKQTQVANAGALEGFHGSTAATTTTHSFSLLPKVYAQTTTNINLTGGYSGIMPSYPPAELTQISGAAAYPIYGVGSFLTQCVSGQISSSTTLCPFAQATGSMTAGQALATQGLTPSQSNYVNPAFVTGAGTLGPLVVYGSAATGSGTGTVLIEVWVLRSGTVMNTGINCSLPVTTGALGAAARCTGTQTFTAQDEDQVVGTITIDNAYLANVVFFLGKS